MERLCPVVELTNRPAIRIKLSLYHVCPPVRGDNPRALASGLSYQQADEPLDMYKNGIISKFNRSRYYSVITNIIISSPIPLLVQIEL